MRFSRAISALPTFAMALLAVGPAAAKDKRPKAPPAGAQDAIQVVGHLPAAGGPVVRFLATQHYSSYYVYAERGNGESVTLIDVTRPAQPSVVVDVAYPAGGPGSLFAAAGTAALVTEGPPAVPPRPPAPQTIRIMDFSDPLHPKVAREIAGVTAISRDDRRGLIFVANSDGIWILRETIALDPQAEKDYARYVVYDH
jgi:hypothetical protein